MKRERGKRGEASSMGGNGNGNLKYTEDQEIEQTYVTMEDRELVEATRRSQMPGI